MARTRKAAAANTEEVKAEEVKAVEEPKPKKTVNKESDEIISLRAEVKQLKEMLAEQMSKSQPIIVQAPDNSEKVQFLWMADVSDDNTIMIGENGQYGRIIGKTGTTYVPKSELSRVLDSSIRYYLEHRWLIVTSGLTEEEREALGVNYKSGELLDEKAFRKIATLGEQLVEIYPDLCDSHKEMVASALHEAYENNKHVDRNVVVQLNKIKSSPAFVDIIESMNEKEAAEHAKE